MFSGDQLYEYLKKKKKSASDTSCVCFHPHGGGGGDDVDDDDGDRTHLQHTVLQINFNRVGHPQVQSCDHSILNSFTEQTLLHGKQENFFPCVINQQCANKSGMNCEKR